MDVENQCMICTKDVDRKHESYYSVSGQKIGTDEKERTVLYY